MDTQSRYNFKFIGRQDGLDQFHSLRSLREQKNTLYIEADGGVGKTRLLKQFIESCRSQRRPWHIGDPDSEVIDFYYLSNRTIDGLRRSIAQRVGVQYFFRFFEIEEQLKKLSLAQEAPPKSQIASLQRELEVVFFQELKQALPKIRNYVVLFFDTFEVVYNRGVGRWFLNEFLTHDSTTGYLIVFAGRPRQFSVPVNVYSYTLKPFNDQEIQMYFKVKKGIPAVEEPELVAAEISNGHPLLLDLVTHYLTVLHGSVSELRKYKREDIEQTIVGEFLNADDPFHQVIREMAYLKRRYDSQIYTHLHGNDQEFPDYEELKRELLKWPFVKYRQEDDSIALHDIFQEMISKHGRGDWIDLCDQLYETIVHGWYADSIDRLEDGMTRDLLRAEQLTYILDCNKNDGISEYQKYFTEIQRTRHFNFNDMLWGEVAEHIGNDKQAYDLTLEQANWLFNNARYDVASIWYEKLSSGRQRANIRDAVAERRILANLGHCYLRIGEIEAANKLWTNALKKKAPHRQDRVWKATFLYNLGHVHYRQGNWEKAIHQYTEGFETARDAREMAYAGQMLFVAARLRARQGDANAQQDVKRGLEMVAANEKGGIHHAEALIYAGDVYRYLDDLLGAENYYSSAVRILESIKGHFDWLDLALSGLGSTYNRRGVLKREQGEDLVGDLRDQIVALEKFQDCLTLIRQNQITAHVSQTFDRLADVYIELDQLLKQGAKMEDIQAPLENLIIEVPEEKQWRVYLRDGSHAFSQLDFLGKAHRLFEIAYLEADKQNDPHLMFDSLSRAASAAQQRGRDHDLEYYATLAGAQSGLDDPRQESILLSFIDLLEAHVLFRKDPQIGLNKYKQSALQMAAGGSFGLFLLKESFPQIRKNFQELSYPVALEFCKILTRAWKKVKVLNAFAQELEDAQLSKKDGK